MKSEYMFLTLVIYDPFNPKYLIDVCMQPLIEQLLQFWQVGVPLHDHVTNQLSKMRAVLMWTVNDLVAYGMVSGWSIAGIIGYPICMDDAQAFYLQHGRKACYFDWHRQFLAHDHLYEKNKKLFTKNRQEGKIAIPRHIGDEVQHSMG